MTPEIEHEHLAKEMLEHYCDTAQTDAVSRILLHLLAVCPECRKAGGMIFAAYEAGAIGGSERLSKESGVAGPKNASRAVDFNP